MALPNIKLKLWQELSQSQKKSLLFLSFVFGSILSSALLIKTPVNLYQRAKTSNEPTPSQTITATFEPIADTYIYVWSPSANYGRGQTLKVSLWGSSGYEKSLLKFDLSSIPQNAIVSEAILTFQVVGWNGKTGQIELYKVLRDWNELQANWKQADQNNNWASPGCSGSLDKENNPYLTFNVNFGENKINLTSLVQDWVKKSSSNFGIILTTNQKDTSFLINSKENPAQKPILSVTYKLQQDEIIPSPTPTSILIPELPSNPSCPGATPMFSIFYGEVFIDNQPAPLGTKIWAVNPRGQIAGCFEINWVGHFGTMHVFGEDSTANPVIPGMREGERTTFYVDNNLAVTSPSFVIWTNDWDTHQVTLNSFFIQTIPSPYLTSTPTVTPYTPVELNTTLNAQADTYLKFYDNKTNFGSLGGFEVGLWGTYDRRNSLLRFDLSSIPPKATIKNATLNLKLYSWAGKPDLIHVHKVLKDWRESEATWIQPKNGEVWGDGGCMGFTDRELTPSAIFTGRWGENNVDLTNLVQNWVNNPASNKGILLIAVNKGTSFTFFSKESSSGPTLSITYLLSN